MKRIKRTDYADELKHFNYYEKCETSLISLIIYWRLFVAIFLFLSFNANMGMLINKGVK